MSWLVIEVLEAASSCYKVPWIASMWTAWACQTNQICHEASTCKHLSQPWSAPACVMPRSPSARRHRLPAPGKISKTWQTWQTSLKLIARLHHQIRIPKVRANVRRPGMPGGPAGQGPVRSKHLSALGRFDRLPEGAVTNTIV